jgi:hypothetical protein
MQKYFLLARQLSENYRSLSLSKIRHRGVHKTRATTRLSQTASRKKKLYKRQSRDNPSKIIDLCLLRKLVIDVYKIGYQNSGAW